MKGEFRPARIENAIDANGVAIVDPTEARSIVEVIAALRSLFGTRLTQEIAGAPDSLFDAWALGSRRPNPGAAGRLRTTWNIAEYLLREEDQDTVRAWFLGLNPELGDRVPVAAARGDPAAVMRAARAFVADG